MRKLVLAALTLGTLLVVGCGIQSGGIATPAPADTDIQLGEAISVDLADWLSKSRAEQAALADEWQATLNRQLRAARQNPASVDLLPGFLPPQRVPGFHKASYNKLAQISLPAYLAFGQHDSAVALHLARLGDHQGARLFAAPNDKELCKQLDSLQTARNFPIEWTRAVALALYSAQQKLAVGDVDGATEIVRLHQQLTALLTDKVAPVGLRAALLPLGKHALTEAARIWRKPPHEKTRLADQIEAALADWGEVPVPVPSLAIGANRRQITDLFATSPFGKAVLATTPTGVDRVLDLLAFPLAGEGAESIAAFLDDRDCLASLTVAYRSGIDTLYKQPEQMLYGWLDAGIAPGKTVQTASLMQLDYTGGDIRCQVIRTNRSSVLGGLVSWTAAKAPLKACAARSLRDFGPAHLDHTFETCRLSLSPAQMPTSPFKVKSAEVLGTVGKLLGTHAPEELVLFRQEKTDLVSGFDLRWPVKDHAQVLTSLLPLLWGDFGPATLEEVDSPEGAYLAFGWKDATTSLQLRVGLQERSPLLVVRDTQAVDKQATRLQTDRKLEHQQRLARLAQSKAEQRLSRSPIVGSDASLASLHLGQTKADALAALPKSGKMVRHGQLADGFSVIWLAPPPSGAHVWLRQLLVRLDARECVEEIRLRYAPARTATLPTGLLLARLSDGQSGVPEPIASAWQGLWGSSKAYRWRDDRTVRLLREDPWGAEVIWWNRPTDTDTLQPPAWQFLPRGVAGIQLDDSRADVIKALKEPVMRTGTEEVFRMPARTPYEMALVRFERDRVSHLRLVHRDRPGDDPKKAPEWLSRAWGLYADSLGYLRRQEGASDTTVAAFEWQDDRVVVRILIQKDEHGPRLISEWRYWANPDLQSERPGQVAASR